MSSFYTRTGDDGFTSLLGNLRVPKYHPRPEAYGDIDEASAALGLARAFTDQLEIKEIIIHLQRDLYGMMAEVAATPENAARFRIISNEQVDWLENQTDYLSSLVDIPNGFILPGDTKSSAGIALARTIIRRAERRIVKLYHEGGIENNAIIQYLNRMSSLLFVMELYENQLSGVSKPTPAKDLS